jgi:hypothetical protein
LEHDAHVDAAKVGGYSNLEWKLLGQDATEKISGVTEHPLCEKHGG